MSDFKATNFYFKQFEPYYHWGLGKWIKSKRDLQNKLNEVGAVEIGNEKYESFTKGKKR